MLLRLSFCPKVGQGSLYDITSCLADWSHVPLRGLSVSGPMFPPGASIFGPMSLSLVSCSIQAGLSDRDPSLDRDLQTKTPLDRDPPDRDPLDRDPPGQRPPGQRPSGQSGRYASYWNAFLFEFRFLFYWFVVMSLVSLTISSIVFHIVFSHGNILFNLCDVF